MVESVHLKEYNLLCICVGFYSPITKIGAL